MVTFAISPKLIRQDERFVLIPQREYESLLRARIKGKIKKLPLWLRASLRDVKDGHVSGPFDSVEALMVHLKK